MDADDEDETRLFRVLVNDEDQYCLWPNAKAAPGGWRDTGMSGLETECVIYVERVWTDMRPMSARVSPGGPQSRPGSTTNG